MLLPLVAAPVYIPTTLYEGSLLSTPSPAFVICRLFNDGHSEQCVVCYVLHSYQDLEIRDVWSSENKATNL